MHLFKKDLIIHESRLDGAYARIESNKTLIEHLFKDGVQRFPHMIFRGNPQQCSKETQIHPNEKELLLSKSGEFTIVETPGGPTIPVWVQWAAVILSVAATVYSFYVANKYSAETTDTTSSSNRSLTQRQNKERPMERIEDIAGQGRSFPTLIQPDYRRFNDSNIEVEYSLMCVGVGEYEIEDVQDDETLVSAIENESACFYGPDTMPGDSSDAELIVGDAFDEEVRAVYEATGVAGGEVFETNNDRKYFIYEGEGTAERSESFSGSGIYWGTLVSEDETEVMTDFAEVGDTITLFLDPTAASGEIYGDYEVQAISDFEITISAPGGGDVSNVDSDWDDLTADTPTDVNQDCYFYKTNWTEDTWLGEYFLGQTDRTGFWVNIVATSGLKYDSGKSLSVTIGIQYAQADSSGNQTGSWSSSQTVTLSGRTSNRIGVTKEITTSFTGPMLMRCRRTTGYISNATLQDVYLDAMYGFAPIGVSDFGNVTTVQTQTQAKGSAANLSTRYFNCLVTRKLPLVQSDGTIGTTNTATKRFIDYLAYSATSDTIGRRDSSELDYQELYDQYQEIITYFGDTQAGEFCYTFDDNDISFQDTADAICGACFSIPVRKNGIIYSKLEQPGEPRTLFNHRNKLPGSQTITRTFINDDYTDGIEYQWVDPDNDDSISTIYIPSDNSAKRPELVESIGVRNYNQAYWNAYRRYNKINNQRISLEDTVTSEGQLLSQIDIVAVTDDTKSNIYAGEIVGVSGLTLYLNQPVEFTDGETHSVSLRLRDGSVEVIGCTEGSDSMSVILDSSPTETPYTGTEEERTRFTFSADSDIGSDYYIISEIDRSEPNEIKIKGYNYTDDFYQNDSDTPEQ